MTNVDPSGHMAATLLNAIAAAYSVSKGANVAKEASATIIAGNTFSIYTALHEIAQVNIYKALVAKGYSPELETKIDSNKKNFFGRKIIYEADITANGLLWEVKPKGGASAKKQITKYTTLGGYIAAPTSILIPTKANGLKGIPIVNNFFMNIEFPSAGEARYSFYKTEYDKKGNPIEIPVTTKQMYNQLSPYGSPPPITSILPEIVPGGLPIPIL